VLAAVVAALAALLSVPHAGAADEVAELRRQLAEARQELSTIQGRLDRAAEDLGALEVRIAQLEDEQTALEDRLRELDVEISDAEDRVSDRVRSIYKHGHVDPMMVLFTSEDPDEVLGKAAVVVSLVREDRAVQENANARRAEAVAVANRLQDNRDELDAALAEQQAILAALEEDLARAQVLESRLEQEHADAERRRAEEEERRKREEEARRQREAEQRAAEERAAEERAAEERAVQQQARPAQQPSTTSSSSSSSGSSSGGSGGYACPMAKPHSFSDTWGAPRSGGRTHQGTDILGPRGAHIYAVTGGTVDIRGFGSSAGYWLILRGNDGTHYYYMHLDGYAVGSGPVSAGQLIGYNGDTGNATGTPHLHFEQHPGGGGPINPYPFLRSICG
jgi:peptidoglycan LD-endopeptidase LytH